MLGLRAWEKRRAVRRKGQRTGSRRAAWEPQSWCQGGRVLWACPQELSGSGCWEAESSVCSGQEGQRTQGCETKWKEQEQTWEGSLRLLLCLPETYSGNYYTVTPFPHWPCPASRWLTLPVMHEQVLFSLEAAGRWGRWIGPSTANSTVLLVLTWKEPWDEHFSCIF